MVMQLSAQVRHGLYTERTGIHWECNSFPRKDTVYILREQWFIGNATLCPGTIWTMYWENSDSLVMQLFFQVRYGLRTERTVIHWQCNSLPRYNMVYILREHWFIGKATICPGRSYDDYVLHTENVVIHWQGNDLPRYDTGNTGRSARVRVWSTWGPVWSTWYGYVWSTWYSHVWSTWYSHVWSTWHGHVWSTCTLRVSLLIVS